MVVKEVLVENQVNIVSKEQKKQTLEKLLQKSTRIKFLNKYHREDGGTMVKLINILLNVPVMVGFLEDYSIPKVKSIKQKSFVKSQGKTILVKMLVMKPERNRVK